MSEPDERGLGMKSAIARRDFLNGFSVALGSALVLPEKVWAGGFGMPVRADSADSAAAYPPAKTGMRGSHDGSWEVAHALRDGKRWDGAAKVDEFYDLIVVGAGISGLAAAHFYRKSAGPEARILILDNHDDFGGHAKRNEFTSGGRRLIGYGGTQSIASPKNYSAEAQELFRDIGLDTGRFKRYFDRGFYGKRGLTRGAFFDKETFGTDRLVAGVGEPSWPEFIARTPLSDAAKKDLVRLYTETRDYLPGRTTAEKKVHLARTSYKDFLLQDVKVHPDVIPFFQRASYGLYGVGIEAVPAADLAGLGGYPGFDGMDLSGPPGPGLGYEVTRHPYEEPYIFHFPDGNASIARMLVRSLVPGSAPGHTMEDIVLAPMDYPKLDRAGSPVRIRLNSTVVLARNEGGKEVEVTYVQDGRTRAVQGAQAVLACWNMIIPYLCPELGDRQKEALAYGVKVPLVYTNVQLRNALAFERLKVHAIDCPGSFWTEVALDFPVSMGGYNHPEKPEDPAVVHMQYVPCSPGLPPRDQQRAGRTKLYTTTFAAFERAIREQLGRMLSPGGFDPAADIQAITVNRWPHGYAYEYNSIYDPEWPAGESPCEVGRQPLGRIHIANSDAGAYAYTNEAIDQGARAVGEILRAKDSKA